MMHSKRTGKVEKHIQSTWCNFEKTQDLLPFVQT